MSAGRRCAQVMQGMSLTMLVLAFLSPHADALYCVQCESTDNELCQIGLVPPTRCARKSAVACVTMVGKYPGAESYTRRSCTSRVMGSFCTRLEPVPRMQHEICIKTCFEDECNNRPAIDIQF